MQRLVIIGGGITGCVAACALARRGRAVRLIEKRRIAAMASGWTLGGVRQSGRHPAELPLARAGGGLIGMTPDHLPAIDGPVTVQLAAELAMGETPSFSIDAFRLACFAGKGHDSMPLALLG
ncbi:MAG: FAD-binding oxidoreductase [Methylocystis sp.]|nr:FAD-binding oxidoreductase [Methylocystis sp.]MCA3583832.1 FAD-binding oxidoreductase [Methylocystis sp.]MCA3589148.1 FAD-binding oxidoreductase [Methylocystis sp.]MCA3589894.1 FAD-binding oxidoreductase [Methylocystis sp.]